MKRTAFGFVTATLVAGQASAVLINEFQPNPTGTDPSEVSIELLGTPGASFSGNLYSIEADFDAPQTIDRATAVSGTFDANGLLVVTVPDLENPSLTLVLSDDTATAVIGDTVDIGDAGTLAKLGNVLDAIGSPDADADEARVIGAALGGTDFAYTGSEPALVFRDSTSLELFAVNFDGDTVAYFANGAPVTLSFFSSSPVPDTFGAVNPTLIPEPTSLALLGLGGLALARRRRA